MPLTPDERKKLLGHGGLARAARRARRSPGHMTQVNKNPELRPDATAMRAITREILKRNPDIDVSTIWPDSVQLQASA